MTGFCHNNRLIQVLFVKYKEGMLGVGRSELPYLFQSFMLQFFEFIFGWLVLVAKKDIK